MPKFGKRRSYSKSRFSRPIKKRFYKKRKLGKYATRKRFTAKKQRGQSKMGFAINMAKMLPDQVYLNNYSDLVQVVSAGNAKATQFMWANQQQTTNNTDAVQQPPANLMCHDLGIVQQILQQQLSTPATSLVTSQVLIKNWSVESVITNLETGPCEFWHYRCIARRDISAQSGIQTVLVSGFNDTAVAGAYPTGVTGPLAATTYGATPFMNPRFTATVKVIKVKKFILNPGKKIRLAYRLTKPRLWKNEDFNFGGAPDGDGSTATARGILRGQHFSVFVLAGTFASASAGNAGYRIGVGNAAVGIITQHKVHYSTITPQVMQTSGINAVAGFAAGVGGYPLPIVANQPYSTINETTGARVTATTYDFTIPDTDQTN